MAQSTSKILSVYRQCIEILTASSRPLSSKCFRYQVCPPKKNAYQVVSKITPQLLEQLQKKSLGAGILQPGRLPHIFSTHPLTLPLVSPCSPAEGMLSAIDKLEARCYFSTSAVQFKKKGKCKPKKNKKKKKKKKKKKGGDCKKEKKCPKLGMEGPCPDIKMTNCKPTDSKICTRDAPWPDCDRKCPPYPSYSESCHEQQHPPPSECRDCPYPIENHPTFKDKPKWYHTGPPVTEAPLDGRPASISCPGLHFGTETPIRSPGSGGGNLPLIPLIDSIVPGDGGFRCGSCDKGGDESCGTKVKKCAKKKKKKKKKGKKKDKCKKKKKDKCKKKPKKRKCNPTWRPLPCPPDDIEHSRRCPTDLIKKPKCP